MKKYFLLSIITLFSTIVIFAQNKPTKGASGIGINYRLSSNVNFPVFKYDYYLSNSWVLTASYKPYFLASTSNSELSQNGSTINKRTESRYSQSLSFGIEKHFFDKLKIDPFVGFSLSHVLTTKSKTFENSETTDEDGLKYYRTSNTKSPIVNSLNPAVNLGLNYFILNNFSVGMQLNLGNSFRFTNGKNFDEYTYKVVDLDDSVITEENRYSVTKRNSFSSELFYSVAIKTAFYFGLPNKQK